MNKKIVDKDYQIQCDDVHIVADNTHNPIKITLPKTAPVGYKVIIERGEGEYDVTINHRELYETNP